MLYQTGLQSPHARAWGWPGATFVAILACFENHKIVRCCAVLKVFVKALIRGEFWVKIRNLKWWSGNPWHSCQHSSQVNCFEEKTPKLASGYVTLSDMPRHNAAQPAAFRTQRRSPQALECAGPAAPADSIPTPLGYGNVTTPNLGV